MFLITPEYDTCLYQERSRGWLATDLLDLAAIGVEILLRYSFIFLLFGTAEFSPASLERGDEYNILLPRE